jgi:hypothetical protein
MFTLFRFISPGEMFCTFISNHVGLQYMHWAATVFVALIFLPYD